MKKIHLRLLIVGFMLALAGRASADEPGIKLGLQSWTCRNMTFEQTVAFAEKHGIKYLQLIPNHLNPDDPIDLNLHKKALVEAKGMTIYTFGVTKTSMDKEANRKIFEFARRMGIKLIVVEPKNLDEWDGLEELVKEYDIRLAIHNHDIQTTYGNPATVKAILAKRDKRIGVCLDVGWITAAGFDAAKVFKEYNGRVYDLHLKDKHIEKGADGKKIAVDTEIGKGDANYPGLFAEIKKSGWSGVAAIETDSKAFAENPNRLVKEAQTFFNMMTSAMGGKASKK
ncbi:MAG: sugar phosphate isomerase/epimerase [Opitutaceae bacterium]|nr:sugar phosphate isomerase/epimerase [Opitutaceae bacterium]